MIQALSELLSVSEAAFWGAATAFFRIGAMMFLLPGFGEASIPMRVRLGAALAFTALCAPLLPEQTPPTQLFDLLFTICSEVTAGVFFALLLRFFVLALQVAGSIAAQSTSLSQIFGGTAGLDPQPALSQFFVMAGLALIMLTDFHLQIIYYISTSYEIWPVNSFPNAEHLSEAGMTQAAASFALGFRLAAPFVLASALYNVTLGVINRAMPQLMVSFIGAPAITAAGIILAVLTLPVLLSIWLNELQSAIAAGGI